MKKNFQARINFRHVIATALICLGLHFLWAYLYQDLPFGINNHNANGIYGIWAFTGCFFAILFIAGGGFLFAQKRIEHYIDKLMQEKGLL